MPNLIVTDRALLDFVDIRNYSVEEWGQTTAEKYLDDLEAALQRLSEAPTLLRQESQVAGHLYFYRVRQHFLVCDIMDDSIYLLTVLHCSMDLPGRLTKLQPTLSEEVKLLHRKLNEYRKNSD